VLGVAGIMEGATATCYPGLEIRGAQRVEEERVVRQGTIITSQGPGTAIDFALDLVEVLTTKENAREVRRRCWRRNGAPVERSAPATARS